MIVGIAPHPQCRISSFLHQHRYSLKFRCDEFRAQSLGHRSLQRSPDPAPPSLHGILWGEFSRFVGTTQCSDSLPSFRPHFVAFVWPYRAGLALRSQARASHLPGSWRLITRSPSGICARRRQGLPGSWGSPGTHALLSDPGGSRRPSPMRGVSRGRRCQITRRLPQQTVFRGSITRPTHSLSTLRSAGHPYATQDSLPAGGWPLPGGVRYPLGPLGRFLTCLHAIPLPQALPGAHSNPVRELVVP